MREMMQKLNIVKYAMSEEEKKKLMKKGFVPVESASALSSDGQNQGTGSQPEPDQKKEKKSGQKTKKEDSNQEPQLEAAQAGDENA